ncbi:outer membrane lipoprotein carrier protein LolA [Flavobacteriaceae bacterium]|nr:outer membrane lipoprotein carrier protein LolA [Flavobacteriaceae bacterium]
MKKIILLFTLFSLSLVHSQNDIRAEKLLNSVSEKIDSSETFKINFTYTLENLIENINQDSDGSIVIKDDNYLLEFMGIKQLCDSKKVYSIVPENEEIIISNIDEDESETIKPSKLLKFYREGYLILWDKKELILEKEIQFVKLIPINSNSDIDYLQLGIDISNNDIVKLIEIGKNKTKTILTVNQLQYDIEIDLNFFIFSEEDYPDYYIENL